MRRSNSRRSRGALLAAVTVAGALALVAAACGGTSNGDKTKTAQAGQPKTTVTVASNTSPSTASGSPTSSSGTPAASTGSPAAGGTTVKIATAGSLGEILTDANGMTLYTYKPDVANSGKSAAPGALLNAWPPLYVTGTASKPSGLTGDLATFMTSDGKQWVTYKGLPLYHFANDTAPGDTKGQGLGGVWFVAMP